MENVISFQKAKKKIAPEEGLYARKDRIETTKTSIEEYWKNIENKTRFNEKFEEEYDAFFQ